LSESDHDLDCSEDHNNNDKKNNHIDDTELPQGRRQFWTSTTVPMLVMFMSSSSYSQSAEAFQKSFPDELNMEDGVISLSKQQQLQIRQRKQQQSQSQRGSVNPNHDNDDTMNDLFRHVMNSASWGLALWLLSGSRSNPIATPLANLLYDEKQEEWLQDRNQGMFAGLPWEYLIIIGIVFLGLGYGVDTVITTTALLDTSNNNNNINYSIVDASLQWSLVAIIGGGFWELGRIASGSKSLTRAETDRAVELTADFEEFASKRLIPGGNCHRSEVVRAFRRYHAKYRLQPDDGRSSSSSGDGGSGLADLEIEKLLRSYCRTRGIDMSQAGFYAGIQINKDADIVLSSSSSRK
jgi:hypothetical protein